MALASLAGVVGLTTNTASAHSFGQPHTHWSGCAGTDCYTWMLANGTWHRGPFSKLQEQWGFVDTICSSKNPGHGGIKNPWGWYRYGGNLQDRNYYTNFGCSVPANSQGYGWSEIS